MLNHPTLDRLNELGLFGMAKAFAEIMASGETTTLTLAAVDALITRRRTVTPKASAAIEQSGQHGRIDGAKERLGGRGGKTE